MNDSKRCASKTVLISLGPTREYIDPVRFITNPSSGKLGYKIAEVFFKNKWKVILVSGPVSLVPPRGVHEVRVETTDEMFRYVKKFFDKADVFISCAAVCDFKPSKIFRQKIKKRRLLLELIPTVDILEYCGRHKKQKQILVGFALETDKKNAIRYAKEKLVNKNLDLIVLNNVGTFESDFIKPTIIYNTGKMVKFKKMTKFSFAKILFKIVQRMFLQKNDEYTKN